MRYFLDLIGIAPAPKPSTHHLRIAILPQQQPCIHLAIQASISPHQPNPAQPNRRKPHASVSACPLSPEHHPLAPDSHVLNFRCCRRSHKRSHKAPCRSLPTTATPTYIHTPVTQKKSCQHICHDDNGARRIACRRYTHVFGYQ